MRAGRRHRTWRDVLLSVGGHRPSGQRQRRLGHIRGHGVRAGSKYRRLLLCDGPRWRYGELRTRDRIPHRLTCGLIGVSHNLSTRARASDERTTIESPWGRASTSVPIIRPFLPDKLRSAQKERRAFAGPGIHVPIWLRFGVGRGKCPFLTRPGDPSRTRAGRLGGSHAR